MRVAGRLVLAVTLTMVAAACDAGTGPVASSAGASAGASSDVAPVVAPGTAGERSAPSPSSPAVPGDSAPSPSPIVERGGTSHSAELRLRRLEVITGAITPKSIAASQTGLFFAQNMMYRHTVTAYDRDFRLVETIRDTVRLWRFGYRRYTHAVRGAPVEAAFTPDGRSAYVSNYSMYGPGFPRPGHDVCSPADGYDRSFVYRISVERLRIVDAIRVGSVPKYVAVTPDGRFVLVTNWCSYDLSLISARRGRQIERIRLGAYPRGIAVDPSSRWAYAAVMGTRDVARVSLRTGHVGWIRGVGGGPRHLVMSPDGRWLYVTLNADGVVAKVDLETRRVVARRWTGVNPRSMTIAPDGRSVYVVNYGSATVTKLRARNLNVLQTVHTDPRPIGIAYDADTRQVWVACYGGSIIVFEDA